MEPHNELKRKRRRRRRKQGRPSISAHLLLDERMKEDVGILSLDLLQDLFPGYRIPADTSSPNGGDRHDIPSLHVAISPWQPSSTGSTHTAPWTILPVRAPFKPDTLPQRPHSSIQFPATSPALHSFLRNLQSVSPSKAFPRKDTPIEITIVDVVPLGLDTVFVSLDTEALRKLDRVQAQFGRGFGGGHSVNSTATCLSGKGRGTGGTRNPEATQERRWRKAVRDALRAPDIIHEGDLLSLPLPSHPITHASAPSLKITACEPVSQGLLLPSTRIVIMHSPRRSRSAQQEVTQITNGIPEEDEDTSNETFYSATEETSHPLVPSPSGEESTDDLNSEASATDKDDLSDDSEDAFALTSPTLPPASGIMSSFQSATPRLGFHPTNGISTPGSIFSATTMRQGSSRGKLFEAHGLLQRIPDDLLFPKPSAEDDDEARVFVDTSALAKIGCFSGDWVILETASAPLSHNLAPWNLGGLGEDQEEPAQWRASKIFGLPESVVRKHVKIPSHKAASRKSSFLDLVSPQSCPSVFASPILLCNLGEIRHLRITPLKSQVVDKSKPFGALSKARISSSIPPHAKEVTLLKLATPLSLDRILQPSLFTSLKEYFEQKRRIVKAGDMLAIAIDESLGRSVFQVTSGDDAPEEEILTKFTAGHTKDNQTRNGLKVAWFKIENVISSAAEGSEECGMWGGAVCVDASNAKMVQAGSIQGRAPSTLNSTWQYYMGVKKIPAVAAASLTKAYGVMEPPLLQITPLRRRLRELISASTSPQAIHLNLPPSAILLTSTQRQIGKTLTAERACEDLGLHTFVINAYDILTEGGAGGGDVKTEGILRARAERALSCGSEFSVILIKHIDALNAERMTTALKEVLADSRVLIATTTEVDAVSDGIRGIFTHELEMTAPDEGEREGILRGIVQDGGVRLAPDVDLTGVAVKTAALVAGDLVDVVDRALVAKRTRLEELAETSSKSGASRAEVTVRDIEVSGGLAALSVTKDDFNVAIDAARKNFADSIGAPKIPNVGWEDVGGLSNVKDSIMETIQLPLARPELFAKGMKKRSGILFYGPPGTGKTLLAKAIATEFSLNFFSVKGPELLNMYIGESEANVRRVFQRARDARPCVVFFDELDSVAPKRGNQGDSGGVMDRIVSQLLAELDGMSDGDNGGGGVFVIGATNRPDLLDQALLRPGRFDKMLYLGISDTHEKQLTILEALTRKFTMDPGASLERVASRLPFTYTGADLYALCSDAMLKAITRQARLVDQKVATHNKNLPPGATPITIAHFFDHSATDEDTEVTVTEEDFDAARRELVPSVSYEELQHYEGVRKTFEGNGSQKQIEQGTSEQSQRPDSKPIISNKVPTKRNKSGAGKENDKDKDKSRQKIRDMGQQHDSVGIVFDGVQDEEEDDDDAYVIKTGHLSINGNGNSNSNGNGNGHAHYAATNENGGIMHKEQAKGKGKGKASSEPGVQRFGDAAQDDDENLYS